MAQKYESIPVTLASAVGAGGSFTVNYPAGRSADDYLGGSDHMLVSQSARTFFAKSGDFSVVFGTSNIAVTLNASHAFASGSKLWLNFDRAEILPGSGEEVALANADKMGVLQLVKVALGAPLGASATDVCASQACTAATGLATGINGTRAASGKVVLTNPRNVVAAWTGNAVLTVTGKDEYGNVMKESSASGVSFTGKKAFKEITGISVSADVTALTVGLGNVLGLPVFLADGVDVLREVIDGAAAGAGTIVAGVQGAQSATTGDVRGTYSPALAPNGSRTWELLLALRQPGYKGAAQYAG